MPLYLCVSLSRGVRAGELWLVVSFTLPDKELTLPDKVSQMKVVHLLFSCSPPLIVLISEPEISTESLLILFKTCRTAHGGQILKNLLFKVNVVDRTRKICFRCFLEISKLVITSEFQFRIYYWL